MNPPLRARCRPLGAAIWLVALCALVTSPSAASSQGPIAFPSRVLAQPPLEPLHRAGATDQSATAQLQARPPGGPATTTLLSLAIPGSGQHVLGQRRQWLYAALEIFGWAFYFDRRAAGQDLRQDYKDFAWDQGRFVYPPRIDGDFEYYETMSKWTRSGAFDADPMQAGTQPETDPTTYNGSVWQLASQIYLPPGMSVGPSDPRYVQALQYYSQRAYAYELSWDWTIRPGRQDEFAGLIHESDAAFNRATTGLGIVLANHLLSAVDAFLSSRGRTPFARLRITPEPALYGSGWTAAVDVPLRR